MSLEADVKKILKKHPEGLRARIIAKQIGMEKRELNRYLYQNKNKLYKIDSNWQWTLLEAETISPKKASQNVTAKKNDTKSASPKKIIETKTESSQIGMDYQERKSTETITEYIDKMIESFKFENTEDFLNADLTEYIGADVNTQFSTDLRRKLRFKKLITRRQLQRALESVLGAGAKFRDGQDDAILALLEGKKVLVVQRTGWGKSLVYFLTTKLLREQGNGPTIIVSPLLALMHNQIESAKKYGLLVKQITSDTKEEWPETYEMIEKNQVDVIFLSPERLGDEKFIEEFSSKIGNISLFAVDEAHCISDWGHDFRPDFRRIVKYVKKLPVGTPILATTATANNRVLRDIKHQLGQDLEIQRGSMDRPSIDIDIIRFHSDNEKDEWLHRNINKLPGTGIIYCLTRKSCEQVAEKLSEITTTEVYHARISNEEKKRIEIAFQNNEFKVLVATIAFGMGIDKPDIKFVIHYHQPASTVAYYQQIGRAGRNGEQSYAIALVGDYDNDINSYFLTHAFPTEDQMNLVINYIVDHPWCSRQEIMEELDVSKDWADKVLKYLLVNGDINRKNSRYIKTDRVWKCDMKRARIVSWFRWKELREFNAFIDSKECYLQHIANELDDKTAKKCNHCANCRGHHFFL